jgi:hypothetical protein
VNAGLVFVPEFLPVFVHDRGATGEGKPGMDACQPPDYAGGSASHIGQGRVAV